MFDTHAHIFDNRIIPLIEQLLNSLSEKNYSGILCILENDSDINYFLKYYNIYNFLYCAYGFHPHNAKYFNYENFERNIEKLKQTKKLVAIGEIGLDFYYNHSGQKEQINAFISQLKYSEKLNLPVVIHSRNSQQIVYQILKDNNIKNGILHCFSGSLDEANKYVELGLKLGITGIITFDKSKNLEKVISELDIENFLVETDSPYLTPSPLRGKTNTPENLIYIIEKISNIKNIEPNKLELILDINAAKALRLDNITQLNLNR